jgi:uncharacterized protein DUF929
VPRKRKPRPRWQSSTVITSVSAGVVALVLVVIVLVNQLGAGDTEISSALPESVASVLLHPNAAVVKAVGSGSQPGELSRLEGTTVLRDSAGKPLITYVGGEYCPFCAAERWTMIYWLSQFGTFKGLTETQSSSTDVDANTDTFSFYKSTYTSSVIDFSATEAYDRNQNPLQPLIPQVSKIFSTYDTPPYTQLAGQFPFLDIAGRYVLYNTSFSPDLLKNLTWDQICADLKDPTNPVCIAIVGNANILTAATCLALGNVPSSVCASPTIKAIEPGLQAMKVTTS